MNIIPNDLKWNGNPTPIPKANYTGIALHHMAHSTWTHYDVHNYHLTKTNPTWIGCGYGYFIYFDGRIQECRGFNRNATVGSPYNDYVLGIGFQGDYENINKEMPKAQFDAGIWLIKYLKAELPNLKIIDGHKYWQKTSCPGKYFPLTEMIAESNKYQEQSAWDWALTKKLVEIGSQNKQPTFNDVVNIVYAITQNKEININKKYQHWLEKDVLISEIDPSILRCAEVGSISGLNLKKQYANFTNGAFMYRGTTMGWLIDNGIIYKSRHEYKSWKGNPKGTLIRYKDGTVFAGWKWDSDIIEEVDNIDFCIQGYNLFPPNNLSIEQGVVFGGGYGEGLGADVLEKRPCPCYGYNPQTNKIIRAIFKSADAKTCAKKMIELGCKNKAIRFDGGDSTNGNYDGKDYIITNRLISSIIYF